VGLLFKFTIHKHIMWMNIQIRFFSAFLVRECENILLLYRKSTFQKVQKPVM